VSSRRLAVTFLHGVEITDERFADTATKLLKDAFARHSGVSAEEALVIRPTSWAPALQEAQDRLFQRSFGPSSRRFRRLLTEWVTQINAGNNAALVPAVVSGALRWLPSVPRLHYPTLRWFMTQFVGDAVAYQIAGSDRTIYDRIHAELAGTMRALAEMAGEDAPVCVIAHSLGTVIASNYFYDLQAEHTDGGRQLVAPSVRAQLQETPLERGETLAFLYTLGSPIALWTLRYPEFGKPLTVPAPGLHAHHPALNGEWINFFDPDDPVAYPLRGLSDEYTRQVTEDRRVSVGPWWTSWTPLAHLSYWNDGRVIDPIAQSLAHAWKLLNDRQA
jgi:hypothetical protein